MSVQARSTSSLQVLRSGIATPVDVTAESTATRGRGKMAESAAIVGASTAVAPRGQVAVGLANQTDFLRPITHGRIEVLAEPILQGRTQQLWQVSVSSADTGKLVARGRLRLANVPADGLPDPVDGHS